MGTWFSRSQQLEDLDLGRCYSTGRGRLDAIKDSPYVVGLSWLCQGRAVTQQLMGIAEIAKLLGVSPQRAHQLSRSDAFPEPLAVLAAGPVWETTSVEEWARNTGRLKP